MTDLKKLEIENIKLRATIKNLVIDGKFAQWYKALAREHTNPEAHTEFNVAAVYAQSVLNTISKREMLAQIARAEGEKSLVWTQTSEAEKYLQSVRKAIGQPTGRFAWCGAFTYWCCLQAGFTFPAAFPTGFTAAYVPAWETWAKSNGTWYSSRLSRNEFNPQAGDIVIFDWDTDSVPDHVGIVLSYDGKRTLTCAEGNTSATNNSNGNSTAVRTRDWASCKGFVRLAE